MHPDAVAPAMVRTRRRLTGSPPSALRPRALAALANPPTPLSEGPTIRGIRTAFAETPVKLRELELGWREKRKVLAVVVPASTVQQAPAEPVPRSRRREGVEKENIARCEPLTVPKQRRDPAGARALLVPVGITATQQTDIPLTPPSARTPWARSGEEQHREENMEPNAIAIDARRQRRPPAVASARAQAVQRPLLNSAPFEEGPQVRIIAPPSPPPTPPPSSSPPAVDDAGLPRPRAISAAKHREPPDSTPMRRTPQPILAAPLPPTGYPVRLSRQSQATISISPPGAAISIKLSLQGGSRTVHIAQDGTVLQFANRDGESKKTLSSKLDLAHVRRWSSRDGDQWELVRGLVERYKRHTPRVRLYLPVGQLIVTCSSPPDIVLVYDVPPTRGPLGVGSATGVDHIGHPNDRNIAERGGSAHFTRVRIRLSRIAMELSIDTAASRAGHDRYRTRRVVRLVSARYETIEPSNEKEEHHYGWPHSSAESRPAVHADLISALHEALSRSATWSEAEREGVRRLIEAKQEWQRYDG